MTALEKAEANMKAAEKTLNEISAHIMWFHSGSADLKCEIPNCPERQPQESESMDKKKA